MAELRALGLGTEFTREEVVAVVPLMPETVYHGNAKQVALDAYREIMRRQYMRYLKMANDLARTDWRNFTDRCTEALAGR